MRINNQLNSTCYNKAPNLNNAQNNFRGTGSFMTNKFVKRIVGAFIPVATGSVVASNVICNDSKTEFKYNDNYIYNQDWKKIHLHT